MSALLALVQSVAPTVQAVASASPSPSPSPQAVSAVVSHAPTITDTLNALASKVSQTDLIAFAATIAVLVQALLNKVPFFTHAVAYVQDVRRFVLSVAVPNAVLVSTSLATGNNKLGLVPWVFMVAQTLFYVGKTLVNAAVRNLTKPVPAFEAGAMEELEQPGTGF